MQWQNEAWNTPPGGPRRQQHKKQARRKTALAFCALLGAIVCVLVVIVWRLAGYQQARREYEVFQTIAEATFIPVMQPTDAPVVPSATAPPQQSTMAATPRQFYSTTVSALHRENQDCVAWFDIPGTDIQYPVVRGNDNEYYMKHTFKKKKNDSGAIFMDCWNAPDFCDFNTVIYGHNMQDGSMFAGLREYRHQWFADKHSTIEITLLDKKLTYRVFAAYTAQSEEAADFRGQGCTTEEQRSTFIKAARKRSTELDSSLTVSRYDRLLTLVTCTSGSHPWYWVVHAVLVEEQTMAEP